MSSITNEAVRHAAEQIGFQLVGITSSLTPFTFPHLEEWIEAGSAGAMNYIPRRKEAYRSAEHVLPSVKSVIMVGMDYHNPEPDAAETSGRIAQYARLTRDYHDVLREKLQELADWLHRQAPGCKTRAVVDTAPLLERDFANQAGLGWFGKNTMLINKQRGSFFFLGALLTSLDLESDFPHTAQHCGTCTRCLEACPTDAFVKPNVLDARRCISYLTIELRDQPVPEELRQPMQDWLFGCDVCQDVCPWNRHAKSTERFDISSNLPEAIEFLLMTETEFEHRFRNTPLERTGRATLARSAAIVLANLREGTALEALSKALEDSTPIVREAAAWALGEFADPSSRAALEDQLVREKLDWVRVRLEQSLSKISPEDH